MCDRSVMRATAQAVFIVGVLIGSYGFGELFYLMGCKISSFLNDDWRLMQIVLCAPSLVFIGYWGIMPESI